MNDKKYQVAIANKLHQTLLNKPSNKLKLFKK